jgi:hypothetical protein
MTTATDTATPARRVALLTDRLLARARPLGALLEFHQAWLEVAAPGSASAPAAHVLDLLELGLAWRRHARVAPRRAMHPDHGELRAALARLRLGGRSPAAVSRLAAWNDFVRDERCLDALDEAVALAGWFESVAAATIGGLALEPEGQLELVRAELASRAERPRRRRAPRPGTGMGAAWPGHRAPVAARAT